MIRWSPSIEKRSRRFSIEPNNISLFPPFMQKKPEISLPTWENLQISTEDRLGTISAKKQDNAFENYVTACKSHLFDDDGEEKSMGKSYVACEDDCRTKTMTCEQIRDKIEQKESFTEIVDDELHVGFDLPSVDYQQEDEESELGEKFESETDRNEQKEETRSWVLNRRESFSSLSDKVEEPNTTDPYLSHQLYLPYNKIQRPRHFQPTHSDAESVPTCLPRRPRSPIRQILPGKFDLKIAYEQWDRKRRVSEKRKYLEESKERILQSIRRLSDQGVDEHTLISSVVLQSVCEQVTLTLTDARIDIDIRSFVNIAVIWALVDLEVFNYNIQFDNDVQPEYARFFNWKQQDIIDVMGTDGMRKILLGVYRTPFSCNVITNLHRRLPWPYLSPSHERGHTKFYPNVGERIDEKIPKRGQEDQTMTYVPDLTCFHLREVLDKSYVAYRRKSKSFVQRVFSNKEKRDLFMQLLSLM